MYPPQIEMTLNTIKHRDILGFVLNDMGLTGEMAEVGVGQGDFAKTVLDQWSGQCYYMIDPWLVQPREQYQEDQPSQDVYDDRLRACERMAQRETRIQIVREFSHVAADQFKALQLDCVYIDGNHSYVSVMADMDAWWPKVKVGGIMGGHDFFTKIDEGYFCEVDRAVIRWAREHGKVFYVSPCTSWWIHKTSP